MKAAYSGTAKVSEIESNGRDSTAQLPEPAAITSEDVRPGSRQSSRPWEHGSESQ
jgi:hypothetical protein